MTIEDEIQDAAEQNELVVGTEETLKRMDDLERVVIASNYPDSRAGEVVETAEDADVAVERAEFDSGELGSLCMKPFTVAVVGLE